MVDGDSWLDKVMKLRKTLEAIDRTYKDGRDQALIAIWRTLEDAPDIWQQLYAEWPESELRLWAEDARTKLPATKPAFGFEIPTGGPAEVFKSLAVLLRALELEHLSLDNANVPSDPASWIVNLRREQFYLVPIGRVPWEPTPTPKQNVRPFLQRGLLSFRIIPLDIDGTEVVLHHVKRPMTWTVPQFFGAALFSAVELSLNKSERGSFVVTKAECADRSEVIATALKETFLSHCVATVFPELTIDDTARQEIQDLLVEQPWYDQPDNDGREPQPPAFVVAGSWHRPVEGGHANIAPVLDHDGNLLAEHHKRMKYRFKPHAKAKHEIVERIVPGQKLHILVLDACLIAIAVCLDFADLRYRGKVYRELDVDLVLVPSFGNAKTIESHTDTARILEVRRKTRAFVVQQAHPKLRKNIGYVLAPKKKIPRTAAPTLTKQSWSRVST